MAESMSRMHSMPTEDTTTQSRIGSLRLGTKICLIVALMLLVASAFLFWTPLSAPTSNGSLFDCKSAYAPPRDDFSKAACGNINEIYQFRAAMFLAGGLLLA